MKLKQNYKVRKIAGESVIVRMGVQNVKMTTIISLNPTSEWLWEQLQGVEFDAQKVADLLGAEYEVEPTVALADANAWIESLRKADLVEE
ncbi:MAG: PqqD family protein [Tidjanibacter sp.]|nr:PqqD family protein [Tidjanibacter sp.]